MHSCLPDRSPIVYLSLSPVGTYLLHYSIVKCSLKGDGGTWDECWESAVEVGTEEDHHHRVRGAQVVGLGGGVAREVKLAQTGWSV